MTSKGIRLNDDMYYECDRAEFEDWKVIARSNGRWKLEAGIDQDNASFIYVRLRPSEGFTRCTLMTRSSSFEERHRADVLYFEDWKKVSKKRSKPTSKSIERHNRRKTITANAREELKKNLLSKQRQKNPRHKRAATRSHNGSQISSDDSNYTEPSENQSSVDKLAADRASKVVSLLKRERGSNSET
ncbi:hypothetical protein KD913_04175 [Klebsiella pneumoniae]